MLLNTLYKTPFLLAPMAGITDLPFRSFMHELGCGLITTELVSATGLQHQSERTRTLMQFDASQHPVGVQIFGENLDHLAYAAAQVEQLGADFVDLNFGCPVPKIVKRGAGSAILKDLKQLQKVLHTVKSATKLPVSIKVRTGWDAHTRNAIEVAHIAYNEGIAWMSVHGRTRAQAYTGQADWTYIQKVKQHSQLPIIGNGDITSATQACTRLQQSGCDAVMIGRGCLKNPWIFQQAQKLHNQPLHSQQLQSSRRPLKSLSTQPLKPNKNLTPSIQNSICNFTQLFARLTVHLQTFYPEQRAALQIKKLASWYSSGYTGSSEFRKTLFQIKNYRQLQDHVLSFFTPLDVQQQADTSHEKFLMGGHA